MKTRVHHTNSTNIQIIKEETYNQHIHQYAESEAMPNQEFDSSSEEMYDDSNSDKVNIKSEFAAEECIPDDGLDLYEEQTVESSYSGLTDYNILKDLVAQSVKNEGELIINTNFNVEVEKLHEEEVNEGNLIKHEYDEVDPNEYEVEHQIQTIVYEEHADIETQEETIFSCEQCPMKFDSPKDLLNHKKIHDDKPFRCQICFRQFRKEMGMKVHITLKHGKQRSKKAINFDVKKEKKATNSKKRGRKNDTNCDQRYECIDCLRSFEQLNYLKNHLKFHNDRKSKPFECGICFKCYGQRGNLDTHKKIHLGDKQFKCHLCTREFFQKGNLSTHLKIHEQAEKELKLKLKLMKRAKAIKTELKTERASVPQTKLNVKRFACEVCSKSFVQLTNLNTHMRTHTGSRPFSCSFCSKTFTQVGNLQKHLKIHTGERPFKCEVCSKAFVQKCQLQKHMNVHSTGQHIKKEKQIVPRIKVFQCKNCSKKYKQNVNLKKHMEKCINTTTTIQQKPVQANTKQTHFEKITNLKTEVEESEYNSDSSDNASVSGNASTDSSNDSSGSEFGNSYYD